MTADFDKARKWRRVQLVSGVALVVVAVVDLLMIMSHTYRHGSSLPCVVLSLITCVAGWRSCQYLRCPRCRERLMSFWLGRDGAGRNCIRRVTKGLPVICSHCGEEVETMGGGGNTSG